MQIGDRVIINPGWAYWDITNGAAWDTPQIYGMSYKDPITLTVDQLFPSSIKTHFTDFAGHTEDGRKLAFRSEYVIYQEKE